MPKVTIREWIWSQHLPPEVMADFEALFKLPEKWREVEGGTCRIEDSAYLEAADELEDLLGGSR